MSPRKRRVFHVMAAKIRLEEMEERMEGEEVGDTRKGLFEVAWL